MSDETGHAEMRRLADEVCAAIADGTWTREKFQAALARAETAAQGDFDRCTWLLAYADGEWLGVDQARVDAVFGP